MQLGIIPALFTCYASKRQICAVKVIFTEEVMTLTNHANSIEVFLGHIRSRRKLDKKFVSRHCGIQCQPSSEMSSVA